MEKSRNGLFLQYLMSVGSVVGGAGTAFMALATVCVFVDLNQLAIAAIMILGTVGIAILNTLLSAKLFRWYNTERAIRLALESHVAYKEALMENCRYRHAVIFPFVGSIITLMGNMLGYESQVVFWVTGGICTLLYIASLCVMGAVAWTSLHWYLERLPENDQQIRIWYRDKDYGGVKIKSALLLPVTEAPGLYW